MTSEAFCNKCRIVTTWAQGSKYQTCSGCRGRFPCPQACVHVDCKLERNELVLDTNMIVRGKEEFCDNKPA